MKHTFPDMGKASDGIRINVTIAFSMDAFEYSSIIESSTHISKVSIDLRETMIPAVSSSVIRPLHLLHYGLIMAVRVCILLVISSIRCFQRCSIWIVCIKCSIAQ